VSHLQAARATVRSLTKECPTCRGRGTWWDDCGDSTCDCGGRDYDCSTCDKTGKVPRFSADDAYDIVGALVLQGAIPPRTPPHHQTNYSGPDSVECALEGCDNRLRKSDIDVPQWCSKEHRRLTLEVDP
jgi:hypothetical protein